MGALEATDAEERLGEAGVTNLVLTLRAAAVKACGGTLVTTRGDARCCSAHAGRPLLVLHDKQCRSKHNVCLHRTT